MSKDYSSKKSFEELKILGEKHGFEVPNNIDEFKGLESSQGFSPEYFQVLLVYGEDFSQILTNLASITNEYEEDKFVALQIKNMGATVDCIPSEIKMFKYLTALDISWWLGKIKSIPLEIFTLDNLEHLELTNNEFQNLPCEISQLKNLKELNLSKNEITSLPKEIGQLKNLKTLYLKNNKITSLPKEIGNLERLENLLLSGNDLETIPDEVSELKNLKQLKLDGNNISKEEEQRIRELLSNVYITNYPS